MAKKQKEKNKKKDEKTQESELNFGIGKKGEMTQLFDEKGKQIPVTKIKLIDCKVSQVRDENKDGYKAVQLESNNDKKKEFRIYSDDIDPNKIKLGETIKGDNFDSVESVDVTGISKGKGFQGVIKRHNFSRGPMSHGSRHHRGTGAIGQCVMPSRVFKGKKMPGRMGGKKTTIKNLKLVKVENDTLYLKGGIPGYRGAQVAIRKLS